MKPIDEDLYFGLYYNDDSTMVCLNISSEIPITSTEFFAAIKKFIEDNKDKKIEGIGDQILMDFELDNPSYNN